MNASRYDSPSIHSLVEVFGGVFSLFNESTHISMSVILNSSPMDLGALRNTEKGNSPGAIVILYGQLACGVVYRSME